MGALHCISPFKIWCFLVTVWALIQRIVGTQDSSTTTEDALGLHCSRSSAGCPPPIKEVYERSAKHFWINRVNGHPLQLSCPIGKNIETKQALNHCGGEWDRESLKAWTPSIVMKQHQQQGCISHHWRRERGDETTLPVCHAAEHVSKLVRKVRFFKIG